MTKDPKNTFKLPGAIKAQVIAKRINKNVEAKRLFLQGAIVLTLVVVCVMCIDLKIIS